jgi:surface polysaccharide O-acyltransferase-like enzyme
MPQTTYNTPQSAAKTLWYDNLRVIATIGVIGIHVSSDYQPTSGTISEYSFWIGNIFDSLSRFSVPVFVMLSGALLLAKEYPIGVFLKKRLMRLVIPFLFWSCIYIAKSLWDMHDEGALLTPYTIAREIFVQFRDGSSLHFWYIYMIVGVYLFIPIIGKWVRNSTEKEQLYFLGIWAFTIIFGQPILEKLKPDIELSYFSGFLGYLVLGYYLNNKTIKSRKQQNRLALSFLFAGLLSTIVGTYLILQFKHEYASTFYECLSPNILLYSMGMFLLLKDKDIRFKPLVQVRNFICRYSYGIFLVHVLIFFQLGDYGINWQLINPIFGIPVTIVVCLIISSAIIFVVNKLPYGKYISG